MRGHKSDLVLLDEAKEFRPCYGSSPLLRIMKELLYFKWLREANEKIFRGTP